MHVYVHACRSWKCFTSSCAYKHTRTHTHTRSLHNQGTPSWIETTIKADTCVCCRVPSPACSGTPQVKFWPPALVGTPDYACGRIVARVCSVLLSSCILLPSPPWSGVPCPVFQRIRSSWLLGRLTMMGAAVWWSTSHTMFFSDGCTLWVIAQSDKLVIHLTLWIPVWSFVHCAVRAAKVWHTHTPSCQSLWNSVLILYKVDYFAVKNTDSGVIVLSPGAVRIVESIWMWVCNGPPFLSKYFTTDPWTWTFWEYFVSWGCENERTTSPVLPKFGGCEHSKVVSNGMDHQSCQVQRLWGWQSVCMYVQWNWLPVLSKGRGCEDGKMCVCVQWNINPLFLSKY